MSVSERVVKSCTEDDGPDYKSVEIPTKPPTEYSYVERRAEILQLIEQRGHWQGINQTELADRYGVTQQQISKDIDRIARHVHQTMIDRDRRAFYVDTVTRRSIEGLLDDEEWRKAAKTAMEYDEWLQDFHDLEALAQRIEELEEQADDDGVLPGGVQS